MLPQMSVFSLSMASAYTAPAVVPRASPVSMTAITPGDVGTTRPLGVYDPLQLMTKMPEKYRRWQEMEIKVEESGKAKRDVRERRDDIKRNTNGSAG